MRPPTCTHTNSSHVCCRCHCYPAPEYEYRRLSAPSETIRLLALNGKAETSLPCIGHLLEASIHDLPAFEAVSYVWGSVRAKDFATLLNQRVGKACSGIISYPQRIKYSTLPLTSVQGHLLACLQRSSGWRLLWIDAICINQDDSSEKAAQIPLMGQIYSKATRVVICLPGIPSAIVNNARAAAEKLSSWKHKIQEIRGDMWKRKDTTGIRKIGPKMIGLDPGSMDPKDELHIPDKEMVPLYQLLGLEWFTRVWYEALLHETCVRHPLTC